MRKLLVLESAAVAGGSPSLEMLVVGPDGLLARANKEPTELAPIGGAKLFQVKRATAEAPYSQLAAKIAEELKTRQGDLIKMAISAGTAGHVFYKASEWSKDGLVAVQFYAPSSQPATLQTTSGDSVTARPIGPPAVLGIMNGNADLHITHLWDGISARIKNGPDNKQAGYVLGERQTRQPSLFDLIAAGLLNSLVEQPMTHLVLYERPGAQTHTSVAIQFYRINMEQSAKPLA